MLRSFWHFCLTVEQVMNPLKKRPVAWVIGGTSGLGLELAIRLLATHDVLVTGRTMPKDLPENLHFYPLDLSFGVSFFHEIQRLVSGRPPVDTLIFAAGFYEEARISEMDDEAMADQIYLGLLAPSILLGRILGQQGNLPNFVMITSTSATTPREREPVYAAVKAGASHLAASVALDENVGRTLVVAPGGMKTKFWRNRPDKMVGDMLDPGWVADRALEALAATNKYTSIRIPRNPARVEVLERR